MKTVSRKEVGSERWNTFCDSHKGAWWWWRGEWLDYQVARGTLDLSFGVDDAGRLIAICPLLLEERDGVRSFMMEGHPGPAFLSLQTLGGFTGYEIGREIALVEYGLILKHNVKKIMYRHSPFREEQNQIIHTETDWRDIPWHTQLLDLTPPIADLWRGVRSSYHSLIHHVEKTHEIVVDHGGKLLDAFRQIHAHEAGRETRPKATWDMMADWCKTGNGLHVCAVLGGVVVACAYFEIYKGAAYFGHAASLHKNVNHALVWRAVKELKARGVTALEMGWLDYPGEESRSVFKTGFGGCAVPIVAVERRW